MTNGSTTLMEQTQDDTLKIVEDVFSFMPPELKDALWVLIIFELIFCRTKS